MDPEARSERSYAGSGVGRGRRPLAKRPNYTARRLVVLLAGFALVAPLAWVLGGAGDGEVIRAGGFTGAGLAEPLVVEEATSTTVPGPPPSTAYDPATRQAEIRAAIAAPTTAYDPVVKQAEIRAAIAPPTTAAPPPTPAPKPVAPATSGSGGGSGSGSGSGGSGSGSGGGSGSSGQAAAASPAAAPTQAPATQAPKPTPAPAAAPTQAPATQAPKPPPPTQPPATQAPKPTTPPAPAPPPRPSSSMSKADVQALIRSMWPDDSEERALQIVQRESNFDPSAYNGWCCYGLFQIYFGANKSNLAGLGVTSAEQLYDPTTNINVALWMFQRSGWQPWGF